MHCLQPLIAGDSVMKIMNLSNKHTTRERHVHDGFEKEVHAIFNFEEYDIRRIAFDTVERVIDIGAHIGIFALFIRSHYPNSVVNCFEPLPVNIPPLRHNTAGDDRIIIHEHGLSSYRHQAEIWLSPNFGHGGASTLRTRDHSDESQLANFTVAVEELARIEGTISILKIDTEGHELTILRNIVPHLARIKSIFLEVHSALALANILTLLNGQFIPFHFGAGMGNRYKVLFASRAFLAAGKLRCDMAPEIYYD